MPIGIILVGAFFGFLGGLATLIMGNSILAALAVYALAGIGSSMFAAMTIYLTAQRNGLNTKSKMATSTAQR